MATKSFLGLFNYEYDTDFSDHGIEVESAYFLVDFGPWKAGQTVEYLGVDFGDCIIYELGVEELDQHIHEVPFMVVQRA